MNQTHNRMTSRHRREKVKAAFHVKSEEKELDRVDDDFIAKELL